MMMQVVKLSYCSNIFDFKVVILAIMINIAQNVQQFLKTCFGMLMPSSV